MKKKTSYEKTRTRSTSSVREPMTAVVQMWGNSLALRIPKATAEAVRIEAGSAVRIEVRDAKLVLEPVRAAGTYDLADMISRITATNVHTALDTGGPLGGELL